MAGFEVKHACCFRFCEHDDKKIKSGKVEICASLPESKLHSNLMDKYLVNWKKSGILGEACFHFLCWESILKLSRSRKASQKTKMLAVEKAMIKEASKTAEFFDSDDKIDLEAKRVAKLITESKHCIAFTGAGISTSAGIGDYRGKKGKWTEEDRDSDVVNVIAQNETSKGKEDGESCSPQKRRKVEDKNEDGIDEEEDAEPDDGVPYEDLRPTLSHEALVLLFEANLLKHIISQNGDGLHGLSGMNRDKLSELHGNVFQEKCEKCSYIYDRSGYVMDDISSQYFEEIEDYGKTDLKKPKHAKKCPLCGLNHRTGRKCSQKGCGGNLIDTIINFRDNLEEDILNKAEEQAEASDSILCLGSTLTVTPANSLVEMGKKPLKLVICNRQRTDCDDLCTKVEDGTMLGS